MQTCPWHVLVPSDNPEPDSEADCWAEVQCGAPVTVNDHGSWRCEAGHWHTSYSDPAYSDAEVIEWERSIKR